MLLDTQRNEQQRVDPFQGEVKTELERSREELNEITLMLEQSQTELNKLAKRNTSINAHLQQIQPQMDSLPRADIRMAYDAALDAQQRLFVMRGQLEKLQSDQEHIKRLIHFLEAIQEYSVPERNQKHNQIESAAASLEMLINAQETERQRLSRQMHDGPAQALSNFILQTEIAMRLFDIDQSKAKNELNSLKSSATTAFQKVRQFIIELRPMMLDDLGLIPTVTRYVETYKEQTGVPIELITTGGEQRLESYLEIMIFRAVQELLNNAVRHGQGHQIKVSINFSDDLTSVTVDDDGKGFDPQVMNQTNHLGLRLIKERVEMLGGTMEIDSVIGKGTRVTLRIPSPEEKSEE